MSENDDNPPRVAVMRIGEVPSDGYGEACLHFLVGKATNGAREITLAHATIPVGGCNPRHRHPNCEEALYVLSGEIEHFVEGTPNVRMTANEAILIPRDAWHQAVNVGETPAVLLVSFSSAERESIAADDQA